MTSPSSAPTGLRTRLKKGRVAISELGDDFEAYLADLLASGRYASRGEALRDGLRLIQRREQTVASLRLKYLQGLTAAERGDLTGAADILSELRAQIAAIGVGRETRN